MRRVARWALGLASLLALGAGGSVLAVGLHLSSPRPAIIGPPPASLPGAEAVAFPSASGSTLRGWWVPGSPAAGGAVVLMHGVWESRLRMAQRAAALQHEGFSVLLFDFQAHGESTGARITFGRLEAMDAAAAVAFVRMRLPGARVGAIGVSLGGAAALLGDRPLAVDALVIESVYPTIESALASRLRRELGWVGPLLTPVFTFMLPPVLGVRPDELRPVDHIGAAAAPLLMLSGTEDDRPTLDEATAFYDRAPQPKMFWAVEGAGHVDLERHGPPWYWRRVLPFLAGRLRTAQPPNRE